MESKAFLNRLRIAPRKVRLVASLLNGMDYTEAKIQLRHMIKRSAEPLIKLLDSVAANAFNKNNIVKENLYIKSMTVNEGPSLKRYKPKGFGSTSPITKRTSHVAVILSEKIIGLRTEQKESQNKEESKETRGTKIDSAASEEIVKDDMPSKTPKPALEKDVIKKEATKAKGFRRFFRRKSI